MSDDLKDFSLAAARRIRMLGHGARCNFGLLRNSLAGWRPLITTGHRDYQISASGGRRKTHAAADLIRIFIFATHS
jgi:hypothetical protein